MLNFEPLPIHFSMYLPRALIPCSVHCTSSWHNQIVLVCLSNSMSFCHNIPISTSAQKNCVQILFSQFLHMHRGISTFGALFMWYSIFAHSYTHKFQTKPPSSSTPCAAFVTDYGRQVLPFLSPATSGTAQSYL